MTKLIVRRESLVSVKTSQSFNADELIQTLPALTRRISAPCPSGATPVAPVAPGSPPAIGTRRLSYAKGNSGYPFITPSTSSHAAVGVQAQPSTKVNEPWARAFKAARAAHEARIRNAGHDFSAYRTAAAKPNKQGDPEMEVLRPAFEQAGTSRHRHAGSVPPAINPSLTTKSASSHGTVMNRANSDKAVFGTTSIGAASFIRVSSPTPPSRARVLSPQRGASSRMAETPTIYSPQGAVSPSMAESQGCSARARVLSPSGIAASRFDTPVGSVRCISPSAQARVLSPSAVISGAPEPSDRHVHGAVSPARGRPARGNVSPTMPKRMISVPVAYNPSGAAPRVCVLPQNTQATRRNSEVRMHISPTLSRQSYGSSMSPRLASRLACAPPLSESATGMPSQRSKSRSKSPQMVRSANYPPMIGNVSMQASPSMKGRLSLPISGFSTPDVSTRSPLFSASTTGNFRHEGNANGAKPQALFVSPKAAKASMAEVAILEACLAAAGLKTVVEASTEVHYATSAAPCGAVVGSAVTDVGSAVTSAVTLEEEIPHDRQQSTASSSRTEPLTDTAHGPAVLQKLRKWSHLEPHVQATCEAITDVLRHRTKLKRLVWQKFKKASAPAESPESDEVEQGERERSASEPQDVQEKRLDMFGLTIFVDLIATHFDLPPYAFGDLQEVFVAYDFDGIACLNVSEVYKFVKFQLEEYREQLGGTPHQLEIPWTTPSEAGYEIHHELGRGKHGIAKLAKHNTGTEVCIKVISKEASHKSRVEDMIEEYSAMQFLQCERIAGVRTIFQDSSFYYMVCDLYRGGDLLTLWDNAEKQGVLMTVDWWRQIFRHCVEALAYMHEQAIMHCDIKESNIMLKNESCKDPQIVVIDLGVSMSCAKYDDGMISGTPGYVPPESLTSLKWFPRGDIFSLGVTMFQLVCGMVPPDNGLFIDGCNSISDIFKATMNREPPCESIPDELGALKNIIADMLEKDRMKRPRAPQILCEEWFTGNDPNNSWSSTRTRLYRRSSFPVGRQHFATRGITKSFMARMEHTRTSDVTESDIEDVAMQLAATDSTG